MITKGHIIKTLREKAGLRQEDFNSICSQTTLSRFEQGKQEISWSVFNQLLHKLGEDPQNYLLAMTTNEKRADALDREIVSYLNQANYEKAEALLDELETLKKSDDTIDALAKFLRIVIARCKGLSTEKAIQKLKEAFEWLGQPLTREDYRRKFFSKNELRILNFLAICQVECDERQAIELFYLQKRYIEASVADRLSFANAYISATYNLSKLLGQSQAYEEALEVIADGLAWCDKYHRSEGLDGLVLNKACILIKRDKTSTEGLRLLHLAYLSYQRKGNQTTCEQILHFASTYEIEILL